MRGGVSRTVNRGFIGVNNIAREMYSGCGVKDITNIVSKSNICADGSFPSRNRWTTLDNERTLVLHELRKDDDNYAFSLYVIKNSKGTISIGEPYILDHTTLGYSNDFIIEAEDSCLLYKISSTKAAIIWGTETETSGSGYGYVCYALLNINDMTVSFSKHSKSAGLNKNYFYVDEIFITGIGTLRAYGYASSSTGKTRSLDVTINSSGTVSFSSWTTWGNNPEVMAYSNELNSDMRTTMGGATIIKFPGQDYMNDDNVIIPAWKEYNNISTSNGNCYVGTKYDYSERDGSPISAISFYNNIGYYVADRTKGLYLMNYASYTEQEKLLSLSYTNMYNIFHNISNTKLAIIYSNDSGATITIDLYRINSDNSLSRYHTDNFNAPESSWTFYGSNGDYFYILNSKISRVIYM